MTEQIIIGIVVGGVLLYGLALLVSSLSESGAKRRAEKRDKAFARYIQRQDEGWAPTREIKQTGRHK